MIVSLPKLVDAIISPSAKFCSSMLHLLQTHENSEEPFHVDLQERVCMLLQRLSTESAFCELLSHFGDGLLTHLQQLEVEWEQAAGQRQEIQWTEDNELREAFGERTQAFVLLNVRSILKRVGDLERVENE